MNEKTEEILTKIFKKIFLILLISFTALYISDAAGYSEFKQHNKKVMNEQKIKKFEKDVSEGKNLNLEDYLVDDTKNYSSNISRIGNNISKQIEKYVVTGLNGTFKFLNSVMG